MTYMRCFVEEPWLSVEVNMSVAVLVQSHAEVPGTNSACCRNTPRCGLSQYNALL